MSHDEDGLPLLIHVRENNDKLFTAFLASVIASLASLNFGYALGYSSPTQKQMSPDPLDKDQFSWFSSIVALGAIVGSWIGAYMVDKLGRKMSIMLSAFFYVPGWCLIAYGNSVGMLYVGRIISGMGVGISALSVPMYISEIASSRYRGGLSCINQLLITFGDVVVYSIGAIHTVKWQWLAIIPVIIATIAILLMSFMPETPVWLLANHKKGEALRTLVWLRGSSYDCASELNDLQLNLETQEKISLRAFLSPVLYRPLIIGCMMMVFQQMVGINAILFFCDKVFTQAGISWDEYASIAAICVLFAFTVVSCLTVDRLGRRILLLIGSVVMFVCMFLLGVYYDLANISDNSLKIFGHKSHTIPVSHISWLALLSVFLYLALFAIGWGPLPWVLMGELFPPRARSQASSMVTMVNLIFTFIVGKTFASFTDVFQPQGTFWFYSGFCILSFLYTMFFVPETKGKTLMEIERIFATSTQ